MSEVGLKKLLTTVLKAQYPGIEEIRVSHRTNGAWGPPRKEYKIWIGMGYSEMEKYNPDEIKQEAREYSKYVIKPPLEVVETVVFFDPYF